MRPSTGRRPRRVMPTGTRRFGVLFVLVVVGSVLTASPASAHAIVERTDPGIDQVVDRSPPSVSMWFNEPVEIAFGSMRVFDTTGRRVDVGTAEHVPGDAASVRVALQPRLVDGTYTVAWRVVSADGHPIQEAFVFHVGAPGPNPRGSGTASSARRDPVPPASPTASHAG